MVLSLTATGFLLLLAVLAGAVFATASFGLGRELFAAVAGLLAALVLGPRRWHGESAAPVTGRQRWLRRLHGAGRKLFVVGLASWLGLIAWSEFSPGGPMPAPKVEPGGVRLLTWNILHGQEHGPPWQQSNWSARKQGLGEGLCRKFSPWKLSAMLLH